MEGDKREVFLTCKDVGVESISIAESGASFWRVIQNFYP